MIGQPSAFQFSLALLLLTAISPPKPSEDDREQPDNLAFSNDLKMELTIFLIREIRQTESFLEKDLAQLYKSIDDSIKHGQKERLLLEFVEKVIAIKPKTFFSFRFFKFLSEN